MYYICIMYICILLCIICVLCIIYVLYMYYICMIYVICFSTRRSRLRRLLHGLGHVVLAVVLRPDGRLHERCPEHVLHRRLLQGVQPIGRQEVQQQGDAHVGRGQAAQDLLSANVSLFFQTRSLRVASRYLNCQLFAWLCYL